MIDFLSAHGRYRRTGAPEPDGGGLMIRRRALVFGCPREGHEAWILEAVPAVVGEGFT